MKLERNVPGIAAAAQRYREFAPGRTSPDSLSKELDVAVNGRIARKCEGYRCNPRRCGDGELSVRPLESCVRRQSPDAEERSVFAKEEAQTEEDRQARRVQFGRGALFHERGDRRRDADLARTLVIEERIEAVTVVLDRQALTIPAPLGEDSIGDAAAAIFHAMTERLDRRPGHFQASSSLSCAKEGRSHSAMRPNWPTTFLIMARC